MSATPKELVDRWQAGDEQAADELYQRFVIRLAGLVANHLADRFQRRIDPEDVLQSAYRTFFRRAEEGQFRLDNDADVWKLLVTIALNKTRRAVRRHSAGSRDVRSETPVAGGGSDPDAIASLVEGPTPVEMLIVADITTHLCDTLGDQYGRLLQLRLEGHSQDEVAVQLGVSDRSVRRMLERIREELASTLE